MESNPYQSPPETTDYAEAAQRHYGPLLLVPLGVAAGVLIGAITNAVSSLVCPEYFSIVMGWSGVGPLSGRIVLQGVLEGAVCGFVFGLILSLSILLRSGMRCPFTQTLRPFVTACLVVFGCWFVGANIAAAWASADPGSFVASFPAARGARVDRFAWVGGSIWGAQIGGFVAVVFITAAFCIRWRPDGHGS